MQPERIVARYPAGPRAVINSEVTGPQNRFASVLCHDSAAADREVHKQVIVG